MMTEAPAIPAAHPPERILRGGRYNGKVMPAKNWPPPGFPLVQGDHALTATWSIHLREQFARRVEDGSLVLWRPGLTLWLVAWGNDNNETQDERLAWIKDKASPARSDARELVR